jgi:long-chain fatty acid transport protein
MRTRIRGCLYLLFFLFCLDSSHAFGAGFAVLQQGSGPMAQGNAFVAQADDPSAVFFNPAGITQLEGRQAYFGGTLVVPRITYDGPGGSSEASVSKVYAPLHIYATQQLSSQWHLGMGIFSPFGLSTVWKGNWEGRYLATYSKLQTVDFNPNIAWKTGGLSVSGGLNVLRADLRLKKKIPLVPFPDGESDLTGDALGYGYNLGLLYRLNDLWQVGLSYRSRVRLNFEDGDADFDVPAEVKSRFPDTEAEGTLDLPPSLTGGIAFRPDSKWTLEFDITWTGWSTYDELKIKFEERVAGRWTSVQPKKWKDVFAYRFGVKYRLSDFVTLRAGYIFDESPVPNSTLDPQMPDGDRNIITAGFDWRVRENLVVGAAYNFIDGDERTKDNAVIEGLPEDLLASGDYEQRVHSLGLSVHYTF